MTVAHSDNATVPTYFVRYITDDGQSWTRNWWQSETTYIQFNTHYQDKAKTDQQMWKVSIKFISFNGGMLEWRALVSENAE